MRPLVVLVCLVAVGCGSSAHRGSSTHVVAPGPMPKPRPFRATLLAPTHTPRANGNWRYRVRATDLQGRPLRARITAQVIDPLGTPHPVQYANTKRNIVRMPFFGTFRDFVTWPRAARGYTFTFRVVVYANGGRKQLLYRVRVR